MISTWLKRAFWTTLVVVILFGVAGAWLAPGYIKRTIEDSAGAQLGRTVSIQTLDISPYALRMKIAGFAIHAQGEGRLIAVDEIDAALSWSSVLRLVPVVDHLTLTGPKLSFARLEPNRYDFSDIVDRLAARPKGGAAAAFVLNHFAIEGGAIDFDDRPEKTRHSVRDLRLRVPFLSNAPGFVNADVEPVFTATANGMSVDLSGKLKPFSEPLGASLKLEFKNLDLTKYVEYAPFPLDVKLASGMIDGDVDVTLSDQKGKGTVVAAKGQLTLSKLDIRELSNAPMIALAQLKLELAALEPFARSAQIQSLSAEGLDVRIVRRAAGFNFDALRIPAKGEVKQDPAESASAAKFSLALFSIAGGKVEFTDETVTPVFHSVAQGIALTAKGLGDEPGSKAQIDLALATRGGESLKAQASLGLAPLTLEAKVAAENMALAAYAPYLAPFLNASLEGVLSASANLHAAAQADGLRFALNAVRLRADNLKLTQPGIEVLRLSALSLNAADIDPDKRSVTGVELGVKEGRVEIKRAADGGLNLAKLLLPGTSAPAGATTAEKETPWNLDLRKAELEGLSLGFEDAAVAPPVHVELAPAALMAEGLSTHPGVQGRMTAKLTVNRAGTIEASGPLTLQPFAAQLAVDAQNLGIVPFQPYFRRFINALVTAGGMSTKGELQIKSDAEGLAASYAGDAGVGAFTLMDAAATQPLVTFKSLQFEGIKTASRPFEFSVGPVTLAEFYSRIVVQPDGRINLQNIIPRQAPAAKPEPAPAEKPAAGAAPPKSSDRPSAVARLPVRIGHFVLQGGSIEFSDQSIKPNFSLRVTELGGSVAGLSGDPATRAEVALKGMVGGNAPLDIAGSLNPLSGNLFVDVKANAKGIDLNPMTPYAARYAGYGIEKGKLSLDIAYRVENRKLDARHKIFLDQLTFGDPVESPEATKLPVLLAVALLKNSRGEIDIELPIGGSLDDPEFFFGAIIGKVIVNLLVKVITAPFALLGAIFGGGGEELSYIEFDPGLAVLGAEQETKLRNLAKALTDRSGLRLEMAGRTEAASDREGLKREVLKQKVRAQKVASTVGQGTDVKAAAEVRVLPAEYADFLKRAYDRESFEKPRNVIGIARTLPVAETEKLILANTEIGEQQLRDLAARRAETVRDWMVKAGGIGGERIFLVAPRDDSSDKDSRAKARGNRVDMYVK